MDKRTALRRRVAYPYLYPKPRKLASYHCGKQSEPPVSTVGPQFFFCIYLNTENGSILGTSNLPELQYTSLCHFIFIPAFISLAFVYRSILKLSSTNHFVCLCVVSPLAEQKAYLEQNSCKIRGSLLPARKTARTSFQ